ncbi:MAG: hypothetical protein D6760_06015 [Deltaproteobacteria bacterium]|nr:MAG: hypothetical protein D6760_06015 [Deltaproteobacteria bacterium]
MDGSKNKTTAARNGDAALSTRTRAAGTTRRGRRIFPHRRGRIFARRSSRIFAAPRSWTFAARRGRLFAVRRSWIFAHWRSRIFAAWRSWTLAVRGGWTFAARRSRIFAVRRSSIFAERRSRSLEAPRQGRTAIVVMLITAAVLWTGVGSIGAAAARASDPPGLLVVVHPSNPVGELSTYEIARIFRGEMLQWPNGRRVQVIDYTEDRPERRAFYRSVYHSGPRRQRPRGSPYVFRPLEQSRPDMIRRLVGLMPNAVAYLPAGSDVTGLKVVARIDAAE